MQDTSIQPFRSSIVHRSICRRPLPTVARATARPTTTSITLTTVNKIWKRPKRLFWQPSPNILEELIYLYTEMKEDPNGIVPYIQTALEADPKNAELWAGLGNVYDNIGKSDEAIKAFEKAREIAPDNFNANFNYALMIIRRADTKTSEFNNADYTSNEQQDAALKELNDIYKSAIDPLEKAHSINAEEPMTIELLKNVYFRLRDASPEMMDKYNKYNDLYQKLQK